MSRRAKKLAESLKTFNNEVIAFVENCTAENWRKVCAFEEWTVGVTARHIGAGHYNAMGLVKMIVGSEKLPELTSEQIVQMANQHARENADCTKAEVLDVLRKHGAAMVDFVAGLDDAELDRTSHVKMFGGDISAQQFIENVVLQSGGEHFGSMKAASGA